MLGRTIHVVVERLERRTLLDAEPVGGEFQVNTHTTSEQRDPVIAMDADGDFVVVWESRGQDAPGQSFWYGVYAQRYNAAGVPQGEEFRVNASTSLHQRDPAVAMDADGNFVITWSSLHEETPGYPDSIFAQRYNAAGVPQGEEFKVNHVEPFTQGDSSVAMDADGDFVVAWYSRIHQDGSERGVFARRFNAAGIAQGGEFQVNTFTTNNQELPRVAMDAAGNFVIAWYSAQVPGPSTTAIFAQRYDAAGNPLGEEFRVDTEVNLDFPLHPSIAMDADGDFVVAWHDVTQGYDVYAQRFNAAGEPQGDEFRVNTHTTDRQTKPEVAMNADGDFVVVWNSRQDGASGTSTGVYAQCYNAAGVAQGEEFRVNTTTSGGQEQAAIAMNAVGDFTVTWSSSDDSDQGIFAQRFAAAPAVVASEFQFATAPHQLRFTSSHDLSAELGTDDLVVENLTSGQTLPSSDFALSYDVATNVATFTYTGASLLAGVLPDGNYRATLLASGTSLPADHVFEFNFLQADANNDTVVNLADFNILAANFGQSPRDFTQGDFNYDGQVNLADFNILAARFGTVSGAGDQLGVSSKGESAEQDEWLRGLLA